MSRRASCSCHAHDGFQLSAPGPGGLVEQISLEGLAPRGDLEYIDSKGSVSGLELERDLYEMISDSEIDEQARRFHNGS